MVDHHARQEKPAGIAAISKVRCRASSLPRERDAEARAQITEQVKDVASADHDSSFWLASFYALEGERDVAVTLRLEPDRRQSFNDVVNTYLISPVTGARVPPLDQADQDHVREAVGDE